MHILHPKKLFNTLEQKIFSWCEAKVNTTVYRLLVLYLHLSKYIVEPQKLKNVMPFMSLNEEETVHVEDLGLMQPGR